MAKHATFGKKPFSLADVSFGRGGELAELIAVLLVLVHLLVLGTKLGRCPSHGQHRLRAGAGHRQRLRPGRVMTGS